MRLASAADQQRRDMVPEVADHRQLTAVQRRVADAHVALVGGEPQRDEVAARARDDDLGLVDDHFGVPSVDGCGSGGVIVRGQAGRRVGGAEGGRAQRRIDSGVLILRLSACGDLGDDLRGGCASVSG